MEKGERQLPRSVPANDRSNVEEWVRGGNSHEILLKQGTEMVQMLGYGRGIGEEEVLSINLWRLSDLKEVDVLT